MIEHTTRQARKPLELRIRCRKLFNNGKVSLKRSGTRVWTLCPRKILEHSSS